ncbi:MAG TPA: hypothetical protein VH165_34445 [Kofleriaceae bacterium]|jgi:hypothetical protein|nr:hypothetical protein [Kofleriaceae bacterium]
MATPRKRKTSRANTKRRAGTSRSRTTGWLPEGTFNPDAPVPIWRGITKAEIAAEKKVRTVVTEHSVRQAVRQLIRLAAIWEETDGFKSMIPELRDHNVRALDDVVALLDLHDREAPIATVAGYRITLVDAELVLLHATVASELDEYVRSEDVEGAIHRLAWQLGNTHRVPREGIERAWNSLSASAGATNWVTHYRGGSEAAKALLVELVPARAAAGSPH